MQEKEAGEFLEIELSNHSGTILPFCGKKNFLDRCQDLSSLQIHKASWNVFGFNYYFISFIFT